MYLIVHDRVGTRSRGHRLMPRRFSTPHCPHCGEYESTEHRYILCGHVSESWIWLRSRIDMLDPSTVSQNDMSMIRLDFVKGLRENAILWLIGSYVEIVESEVVIKENKLSPLSLEGLLKQRKLLAATQAIPELGLVPGIDWNSEGIG